MKERVYSSHPRWWDERTQIIVRGVSPYVPLVFHENRELHDFAMFMLGLESKYDRRWRWWSPRIPPPIFQMDFVDVPPPGPASRAIARAIVFWLLWRLLRAR